MIRASVPKDRFADLLMSNMAVEPFLIYMLVHVYNNITGTRPWDLVCKNTPKPMCAKGVRAIGR